MASWRENTEPRGRQAKDKIIGKLKETEALLRLGYFAASKRRVRCVPTTDAAPIAQSSSVGRALSERGGPSSRASEQLAQRV